MCLVEGELKRISQMVALIVQVLFIGHIVKQELKLAQQQIQSKMTVVKFQQVSFAQEILCFLIHIRKMDM